MIDSQALEKAIADRLALAFKDTGIEVALLPDTEADIGRLQGKGRIFVSYQSADFEDRTLSGTQNGYGSSSQTQSVEVQFYIEARKRRGDGGVLDLMDSCKLVLAGFRPLPNAGKLYPTSEGFFAREENTWAFVLTMRCACQFVEPRDYFQGG